MAHGLRDKRLAARAMLLCAAALGLAAGCQKQKGGDTVKTYTADKKAPPPGGGSGTGGGSGGGSGGQSDAKPLDAPADTTNGKSSKDSDAGANAATHGQVVAEPGAPVEHEAPKNPPKADPNH